MPGFPPVAWRGTQGSSLQVVSGRYRGPVTEWAIPFLRGIFCGGRRSPCVRGSGFGVRSIVFTNAAGGILENLVPGDLVLIADHINAMFQGPLLRSESRISEVRFPYDPMLRRVVIGLAAGMDIPVARGTYAAVLGPAYQIAAEIRALELIGADVVGMSAVLEVVIARALGIRCLAFSMVVNKATEFRTPKRSHEGVIEVGRRAGGRLTALLTELIPRLEIGSQSTSAK